jgi:hypothetical protein
MVRSTALLRKVKLVLNALVSSGNYLLWVRSAQERLTVVVSVVHGTFAVGGGETKVSCKFLDRSDTKGICFRNKHVVTLESARRYQAQYFC